MRRIFLFTFFIVLLVSGVLVWGFRSFYIHPLLSKQNEVLTIKVFPQDNMRSLLLRLQQKKLYSKYYVTLLYARLAGLDKKIQVGEYRINSGMTMPQLLQEIVDGKVVVYTLTCVEGWTLQQFLQLLDEDPHLKHDLVGLSSPEIAKKLGIPYHHLQGLFFPDTYSYHWGNSDEQILLRAYVKMQQVLQQQWQKRAVGLRYKNSYQALIMASLIERETPVVSERPKIAGVLLLRLQKRMRLQVDPTVKYAMYKTKQPFSYRLRRSDLRFPSVYNTYLHYGLPPTPIALPSLSSIHAALHPEMGKALFYVANGDGSHTFSTTYKEHKLAIKRYRKFRDRLEKKTVKKKAKETAREAVILHNDLQNKVIHYLDGGKGIYFG